jgi:1-acyl-sn-glycerol-3-phosphate acyltransferase
LIHLLVLRPVIRVVFGIHMVGREHVVGLDQLILIANHNSHLDILLMFTLLPRRLLGKVHATAAADYFARRPWLFRVVDYLFRPVWIDRESKTSDPVGDMAKVLAAGESLVIFPEGTRGEPGQIARFRTGVGRLIEKFRHVPVVPVLLSGPERSAPRGRSFPVPFYNHVAIGPPQLLVGDCYDSTVSLERMVRDLSESAVANRHHRVPRARVTKGVAVLGIDGSGKSTVSRELARRLSNGGRVCRVSDELQFYEGGARKEVQPLLTELVREAVGRYAKAAKSLKHYKVPKLAELLLRDQLMKQVRRWYAPEVVVLDGSPLLNLMAWTSLYKADAVDADSCANAIRVLTGRGQEVGRRDPVYARLPELKLFERLGLTSMCLPDMAMLLDVDPAESIRRIERRDTRKQVHETEEKLTRLRQGYLDLLGVVDSTFGVKTRILDGGAPLESVTSTAIDYTSRLGQPELIHA